MEFILNKFDRDHVCHVVKEEMQFKETFDDARLTKDDDRHRVITITHNEHSIKYYLNLTISIGNNFIFLPIANMHVDKYILRKKNKGSMNLSEISEYCYQCYI